MVNPGAATSPFLHDWVFQHADRRPEAPALATPSARFSYSELARRVRQLAAALAASGLEPGDKVLLALPNVPAGVVVALATNALGGTVVEVNREWDAERLGAAADQCGARHAFFWGRDVARWRDVLAKRALERLWVVLPRPDPEPVRKALGDEPDGFFLEDGRLEAPAEDLAPPGAPKLDPDAPALVLYTSGSTGRPRGVIQTFRNIDANARSIVEYLRLGSGDRALLVLPLHYCYARSVLHTHLLVGGSVFLESRVAFPRVVLESMRDERCTGFAGVPLTFEIFRRHVDLASLSFPHLRYVTQAGGAMAQETIDWARRAFHPAELFVMYGQTEATARLSYLPPEHAAQRPGSIGIPIPGVELRVVGDTGEELPSGETGHLVARGDNITPGYLDDPEETSRILRDGWLWTGDLAVQAPDGFLYLKGRSKEMLKIGGHRLSPVEIEQVLARHPSIAEAAVIGVADGLMGEVPVAYLVSRSGTNPPDDDLRRHCRELLPAHAVPVRFLFVGRLPRNEAGKLLRGELSVAAAKS